MSRKALFTTLGGKPKPGDAATATSRATNLARRGAPRQQKLRMRPILGSPELISDPAATPVGGDWSIARGVQRTRQARRRDRKKADVRTGNRRSRSDNH